MSERAKVGVFGASGYVGAELLRRLATHPRVEVTAASSRQYAGQAVGAVYPQLRNMRSLQGLAFSDASVQEVGAAVDVLFLALPHGASAQAVAALLGDSPQAAGSPTPRVIDMSGDFRLDNADVYRAHYHQVHPCPAWLGQFVYGISEWRKQALPSARLVANPGCFATAICLGLAPLAAAHVLPQRVTVVAVTGSTGSGATAARTTHHPERATNFKLYKAFEHQHTPEILKFLGELGGPEAAQTRLSFIPASAPMTRGIFATIHLRDVDARALADTIARAYEGAPFVRVHKGSPELNWCLHANFTDIGLIDGGDELVIAVSLDNLVKGASGQGIQNMNLMMGWDEDLGLQDAPSIP
jgi:LysW-gamma-L-alpha-aminoadipyl-6-phosphate/LysW-L-glutamyl-5-phosphate reductase